MVQTDAPLVNNTYLLQKFPGKGGWTYASIPEIDQDRHSHFGWVRVRGFIDSYEIKAYNLMPMGNGSLFLPVRAEIRKKINKKEGDYVKVVLYKDDLPLEIPEELIICLKEYPGALERFQKLNEGERKQHMEHIYSAKSDETKVERIAKLIDSLV
jgi:hypothetical protein